MLIKLQESQKLLQEIIKIKKEEILRERSISPKLRPKITDALRLKEENWRKNIIGDLRLI